MASNSAQQLLQFGQSIWYDNISRALIESGELKRLMADFGIRGVTTNPTIFDNALRKSAVYDAQIKTAAGVRRDPSFIFEALAVRDVADGADLLRPIYEESEGGDGFISIEVSPLLASDTAGTINEARQLVRRLNRPNVMIKVPGTPAGLPAVRQLLEEGVNVNVTLLFSVENYVEVARTYIAALQERRKCGKDLRQVRSVASFFVSRVDTVVDKRLEEIARQTPSQARRAQACQGRFGVANSRLAYQRFKEIFSSAEFKELAAQGAAVQRPLWASTGVKNPAYRDVLYVEELIGAETVNTVPPDTLLAFVDHGRVAATVERDIEEARRLEEELSGLGVDIRSLLHELQLDGVRKFSESFQALQKTITEKLG